ncbi:short chain dehydrogenase [Rhizodiscina lignyota]|uniref:Short chain dehydrogenase n=1 Tax=Rhizodiscina lignyota TaxID=1504668 RepID=A0A9P4MCT4_9PEZI|nr:short chain dehydrogenase [Rhizodiscina lignyota]
MKIENRTFVVSGGASGLGEATVRMLHANGGFVSILDMNAELGNKIANELSPRVVFFKCDVTDTDSIAQAVKGTMEWVGKTGKELGGCVPAAGVGFPGKIIDSRSGEPIPISSVDLVLKINLRGTIDLMRQVSAHLIKVTPTAPDGERGVFVMVASSAAYDGQPGQMAYSASKGAVVAMTLPIARDLARYGIRVVTIAPSLFKSAMTAYLSEKALKSLERVMEWPVRPGNPDEFARTVKDSIENVMLNGTVIRLDGAMRMPSKM